MTICKGCGVTIQHQNKDEIGYSSKTDTLYCQRCFRIQHYDDLIMSMKTGINPYDVLSKLSNSKGLIIWICDLFDFEASMIDGLNRHLNNKDIILVGTKRDLLPKEVSNNKLISFIKERLKERGIKVKGILITSDKENNNSDLILELLKSHANKENIFVIGKANAGKSTFLNMLLKEDVLTKSRYPGTTLDFNEIVIGNQKFVDTPGIEVKNSMVMLVEEKHLNYIIPTKKIKPVVFQLENNQSLAFGGLVRIDFIECEKTSVVIYMSDKIVIHRTKVENADKLWEKHKGHLLVPTVNSKIVTTTVKPIYDKTDIVIDGLGWICINKNIKQIKVSYPKDVNITFRKAMI